MYPGNFQTTPPFQGQPIFYTTDGYFPFPPGFPVRVDGMSFGPTSSGGVLTSPQTDTVHSDSSSYPHRISAADYSHHPTPIVPSAILPATQPSVSQPKESHEFWKDRIAPLPGSSVPSHPVTLSAQPLSRPSESPSEIEQEKRKHRGKLPPPRSFVGNSVLRSHSSTAEITAASSSDGEKAVKSIQSIQGFQFDRYADVFVPRYLKNIQHQLHSFLPLSPLPRFPSPSYLNNFFPASMISGLINEDIGPTLLSSAPISTASSAPPLTIDTYHRHWAALLAWELDQIAKDKGDIILWKIGIKVNKWSDSEFLLLVPGIRENYPRLDIGDLIHMREVLEVSQCGSGIAFEGRVVALRKREGLIHFYCPALKTHIQTYLMPSHSRETQNGLAIFTSEDVLPLLFNISFLVNASFSVNMDIAAGTMGKALLEEIGADRSQARQWLFPEIEDINEEDSIYHFGLSYVPSFQWSDPGLNDEQKLTVTTIALHRSPVPYLISGPPGTGKTRTVVEIVQQILRVQPEACVLLCAPSNPATDTLALRLRPFLQPHEMLRLNDQARTFAEIPHKILQYCYIENDSFALPPWKKLMQYKVVVCSCSDASILVSARCTNASLASLETEIISTLHPFKQEKQQVPPHWTHLIIDEAAQGSEPELLIPISVIVARQTEQSEFTNGVPLHSSLLPQLVLCGDPNQLGPIVTSDAARNAELDISLLERLFERPLYAGHERARSISQNHQIPLTPRLTSTFVPFANLVKNYRSHPAILMPPSAIFYNDSLEPYAQNGSITWSGLPNPNLPLVFFGHGSDEECLDERATWYNNAEINCVVETVASLLSSVEGGSSPPLRPAEIGVMAPWREQVWKIRERLRKERLSAVDVGTVEDYQGRESRVIIISCVRSRARFLKDDLDKGVGLVFERKRMNVAITRAKELLIVIGNGTLLGRDPYWKSFLQFAIRNKLYVGPKFKLESDGSYISRLESEYIEKTTRYECATEEEKGIATAGGIAREVLRE